MFMVLPTLLCLGLYLAQGTRAQDGRLPPPVITALPASVVLSKSPVTILCQGPPDAEAYEIFKEKGPEPRNRLELQVSRKNRTLNFQEMKPDLTGLYRCSYRRGEHQSLLSAPLLLVMTGAYDKPSLSSMNSTVVASGDNVDLQCFSKAKFEAFVLTRDDAPHPTQRQSSTPQDNGRQATFHLDHVSPTQAGAYRCYGVFTTDPYLWSHPSDPLELVVTGSPPTPRSAPGERTSVITSLGSESLRQTTETTRISGPCADPPEEPAPTEPRHPHGPNRAQGHGQWYLLVGLPVAAVLLLLLLLLFLLIKNKAAKTKRQPQASNPMSGRASEARDPQDVTYLQVAFKVPTQGSAATPSSLPREAQTSEYATVALR